MSLDGRAELISGDPSPPRARAVRPSSSGSVAQGRMRVQRSLSALPFGSMPRKTSTTGPFVPNLPTGRSRDARTWEFCADAEARDELTTQAENESHGSAVAAISLLRSTSNTTLKPNPNKRNAPSGKAETRTQGKKAKLARTQSSVARLQSTTKPHLKSMQDPSNNEKMTRSPSGDSDKENWVPGENAGNPRRRLPSSKPAKQKQSKAVLQDNNNVPTHALDLGGRNKRRKQAQPQPSVYEDEVNSEEPDKEVEKFMRGELSPSKKGDLDCVQGLLSLSQGNWR